MNRIRSTQRTSKSFRSSAVLSALFGLFTASASGEPIDPDKFASLGVLSGAAGAYALNTGDGASTPTLTEPGGVTLDGVIFAQPTGGNVAVFDFDTLTINAGMAFTITGSIPLVLLSRGDATIDGGLDVSGGDGGNQTSGGVNPGGAGVAGGGRGGDTLDVAGVGGGPGVGGVGSIGGGGGGFGGMGGAGLGGGAPGATYGDLTRALQAGSGGGGGLDSGGGRATGGGAGGGAIEIGAIGMLNIGGSGIHADGGIGAGGGAGSGGGIILFGNQVNLTSVLSADGGDFSFGGIPSFTPGGGGGGGRILIETGPGGFNSQGAVTVNRGRAAEGQLGQDGTIVIMQNGIAVPEPSSVILMAVGLAAAVGWNRRSRRAA